MKQYRVTCPVTFWVAAESEDEAVQWVDDALEDEDHIWSWGLAVAVEDVEA